MRTLGQCRLDGHDNRFDHIRLIAATLVIFSHCWPLFGAKDEPFKMVTGHVTGGQIAVAMFFVVSGFLVYRSAETSSSWMRFAMARILRIVPGATVCALFCILVIGLAATTLDRLDYLSRPQTWAFLKNAVPISVAFKLPGVFETNIYPGAVNGSLWTLPIEIRLYVICALAFYLARSRWTTPALAALGLVGALWVLPALGDTRGTNFWIAHYGFFFFAGAALYVWRDRVPLDARIMLVLTLAWVASFGTRLYPLAEALWLPYAVIWIALPARTAQPPAAARAAFRIPDISYGLYIYGFPVQQTVSLMFGPSLPFAASMAVSLAAAAVLATLSWYLVEKPALRLKSRPFRRPATAPAAAAAQAAGGPQSGAA